MFRTQLDAVSTVLGIPSSSFAHVRDALRGALASRDDLEKDVSPLSYPFTTITSEPLPQLHAMALQYVDARDFLEVISNEHSMYAQCLVAKQKETEMEIEYGLLLEQKCESYRAAGLDHAQKILAFAQVRASHRNGL